MTELTTLTFPTDTFLILAGLIAIAALSVLVVIILPSGTNHGESPLVRYAKSLGIRIKSPAAAAILLVVIAVYAIIFLLALIIAFRALGGMVFDTLPEITTPSQTRAGLAFGTLLAAILGAPFIIWRSWIAAKQTAVAEESLFNDKINAAATDLAARRTVTRTIGRGAKMQVLSEEEDDLVTRAAAIDRLEGLALEAIERDDYPPAQRIARMLSIYLQELSRAYPPQDPPKDAELEALREWAKSLTPIRPDMHRAAQSLGRINPNDETKRKDFDPSNIDLRRCNLQGFDLHLLTLCGTNLSGSKLHGAWLFLTQFEGANLSNAALHGTDLSLAQMRGANLSRTQLVAAKLVDAPMQGAKLHYAELQQANLEGINARGANFHGAQLQGSFLEAAQLQGASFIAADLQRAYLSFADLQGADFRVATLDGNTNLTEANLRGAAIAFVKSTTLEIFRPNWDDIIVFSSTLPDRVPMHWVRTNKFAEDDVISQWRAWAASLDPPVTIAPDYRR